MIVVRVAHVHDAQLYYYFFFVWLSDEAAQNKVLRHPAFDG
jgi:hypothetical protein